MNYAIQVSQLSKSFAGQPVLQQLDMQVPEGVVYGFLGNNGAGKSTLLRILLGMLQPDSGQFTLLGQAFTQHTKQQIGALIDSPCLYEHLTARQCLTLITRLKNLPKTEVDRALAVVGLSLQQHRCVRHFSLGMKQRLAIATALLGEPPLLILDEPSNGLDPSGMEEIRDLIRQLPQQSKVTVLVSSHLLDEVEKIASHIAILHGGKLVIEGALTDVLASEQGTLSIEVLQAARLIHLLPASYQTRLVRPDLLEISSIKKSDCPVLHQQLLQAGALLVQSRFTTASLECRFHQLVNPTGIVV